MTERWHSTSALAGLPGMPGSRSIRLWGERKGWTSRRHGRTRQWLESSLPEETQRALQDRRAESSCGQPHPDAGPATIEHPQRRSEAGDAGGESARTTSPESRAPVTPPRRAPSAAGEAVADARLDIVDTLNAWLEEEKPQHIDRALDTFAAHYKHGLIRVRADTRAIVESVERTTLIRWRKLRRTKGWSGLIPGKRGPKKSRCSIETDPAVRDTIVGTLTDRPHSSATFIHQGIAARFASEPARVPALRTVQRYLRRWKKLPENERLLSQLTDPDKHRSRRMPAPGDMAAAIERLNQLWEADSTSVDVMCTDGHRSLIAVIDVYTRRFRVLVTERDRTEAVLALFRRCLLEWGVPEVWRCDNGASYGSRYAKRVISDLEITPDPCRPYDPNGKAFVERVLKTLSHGLFENLPGYKGHSIAEQQALRARHAFSRRLGMPEGDLFEVSLSAAELQQRCDDWITYIYERAPHEGLDKRSPFEVTAAWRRPVKRIANERALDVLLYPPAGSNGWASIGHKGIKTDKGGTFIHADLPPPGPEQVQVRQDPADLGRILVLDGDGRFICWAFDPDRLGLDRTEIAAKMKARARHRQGKARGGARAEARHQARDHPGRNHRRGEAPPRQRPRAAAAFVRLRGGRARRSGARRRRARRGRGTPAPQARSRRPARRRNARLPAQGGAATGRLTRLRRRGVSWTPLGHAGGTPAPGASTTCRRVTCF